MRVSAGFRTGWFCLDYWGWGGGGVASAKKSVFKSTLILKDFFLFHETDSSLAALMMRNFSKSWLVRKQQPLPSTRKVP